MKVVPLIKSSLARNMKAVLSAYATTIYKWEMGKKKCDILTMLSNSRFCGFAHWVLRPSLIKYPNVNGPNNLQEICAHVFLCAFQCWHKLQALPNLQCHGPQTHTKALHQ